MNLLKSVFISGYMMLLVGGSLYGGWMVWLSADQPIGWGLILTTLPMMMQFSWLMLAKSQARTSRHFLRIQLLSFTGLMIVLFSMTIHPNGLLCAAIATGAFVGLLLYVYWYSSLKSSNSAVVQLGQPLPPIELVGHHGLVNFNQTFGDAPVIMLFFRGNWCPLCMAQLKELASQYQLLQKLGVRVALISPQSHDNTRALAEKLKVAFEFYADPNNKAAEKLGLVHPNGLPMGMQMLGYDSDTVLPTMLILAPDGKVVWQHQTDNYRIRPEPEVFIGALRELGLITQ